MPRFFRFLHKATKERAEIEGKAKVDAKGIVEAASKKLMSRFFDIDLQTKRSMDKILSLYQEEKIDASAFHGRTEYFIIIPKHSII